MLILKRKLNEGIIIADEIIDPHRGNGHGYVRLGIDAQAMSASCERKSIR